VITAHSARINVSVHIAAQFFGQENWTSSSAVRISSTFKKTRIRKVSQRLVHEDFGNGCS